MTTPNEWDGVSVVTAVREEKLSVTDVADALLARIAERGVDVGAWAWLDPDQVRGAAQDLDAASEKGPLHGLPVGVKDVINTKDMPTAHNTARYQGSHPGVDAACVDTLRAAGALVVGKTTTTEFAATTAGGPARNPHDLGRTPGGSSSGSCAVVADYQSTIALGTQTGGSTIRPASFTGIYGWKPTWNSVSREGLKMYSATCDTLGLYARSARDLLMLADVFRIEDAPMPETLEGARVALCRTPVWGSALPATWDAMTTATRVLREAGAEVFELDLPEPFEDIPRAHGAILRREGRSAFLNEYLNTPDLKHAFKAVVEDRPATDADEATFTQYGAEDYRKAYRLADRCRALFDDIATGVDLVLTPSSTGEAPQGLESTGDAAFNSMWTLLQVPVVNVPGLHGPAGMPVGVSLVTRRYDDRVALGYAALLGAALSRARPAPSAPG